MSRTPMGLIWTLMRAKRRKLVCSRCIISSDGDLLYGSGVSDHIVSSWFSQSILWGVSKVMRHHVESGKVRYDEWSHMAIGMRFRAGAMGVPFLPIRSMLGSDIVKLRPEGKEFDCPFTAERRTDLGRQRYRTDSRYALRRQAVDRCDSQRHERVEQSNPHRSFPLRSGDRVRRNRSAPAGRLLTAHFPYAGLWQDLDRGYRWHLRPVFRQRDS